MDFLLFQKIRERNEKNGKINIYIYFQRFKKGKNMKIRIKPNIIGVPGTVPKIVTNK